MPLPRKWWLLWRRWLLGRWLTRHLHLVLLLGVFHRREEARRLGRRQEYARRYGRRGIERSEKVEEKLAGGMADQYAVGVHATEHVIGDFEVVVQLLKAGPARRGKRQRRRRTECPRKVLDV